MDFVCLASFLASCAADGRTKAAAAVAFLVSHPARRQALSKARGPHGCYGAGTEHVTTARDTAGDLSVQSLDETDLSALQSSIKTILTDKA